MPQLRGGVGNHSAGLAPGTIAGIKGGPWKVHVNMRCCSFRSGSLMVTGSPSNRSPGRFPHWTRYGRGIRQSVRQWSALGANRRSLLSGSRNLARWALIAVPIGVVAGIGAVAFYLLWYAMTELLVVGVVGITYPLAGGELGQTVLWGTDTAEPFRILLLPLVMTAGGYGAGLIAQRFAPEIQGHGTDEAINAFHHRQGQIRARVPLLKIFASALTLGSGGAGGREGPVAQVGGGFGSVLAGALGLNEKERRVALATGLGAGVGAIFKAPLGGALYATEIMYTGDFEPEVFVPAVMASVTSYAIFGLFFGFNTLFTSPTGIGWNVQQIPLYALLGLLCAGAGLFFIRMYLATKDWFQRMRWPLSQRTALGALIAGVSILGVFFLFPWDTSHFAALSSIDVGYGFVQAAMFDQIFITIGPTAVIILAVAVILRMVTTSMTVGSGGSAGLFGTSVVIGALLGSGVGGVFHILLPHQVPTADIAAFAIVGMMAFFGGISKAPLAVLVMVVEMAGTYSLLLPAMLAIFIAYAATGNSHIYVAQVESRIQSPAHRDEYRDYFLQETPVLSLPKAEAVEVTPSTTVKEALEVVARTGQTTLPMVDGDRLLGVVRFRELVATPDPQRESSLAYDRLEPCTAVVTTDATAAEALRAMENANSGVAAIVTAGSPVRYVGLVTRGGILHMLPKGEESAHPPPI